MEFMGSSDSKELDESVINRIRKSKTSTQILKDLTPMFKQINI